MKSDGPQSKSLVKRTKKSKGKRKLKKGKKKKAPRVRKRDLIRQFLWETLRSPNRKTQRKAVQHIVTFAAVTAGFFFFGDKLELH